MGNLHLPEHTLLMLILPVFFLNAFVWAFLFVFFCRAGARFVRAKRKGLHDAA